MKKSISLFIALLAFAVTLSAETATVLYEHQDGDPDVAVNWNQNAEATFTAAQLSTAQAGDFIQVTVAENGTSNYPSACISSKATWTNMLGTCSFSMTKNSGETHVFRYGLTPSGLNQLQAADSYVNGAGFNLLKIEHISTASTEDLSNTIWFGNMVCSWSGINLIAGNFAVAEVGYTLRVHHSDLGTNAKMALMHNYAKITGYDYALVHGDYTDYVLTQNILDTMATGNFRISAYNLTLTQVELIAPQPETSFVTLRTTMWEGEQEMGWSQLCPMGSFISQIAEGDSIYVTVSEKDPDKSWQQLRVAWSKGYVSFACYNDSEFPRVYALQVVDTMYTQMNASGKLYLSGTGVTVTKVELIHKQEISNDRGNAATTVWSGAQTINWGGNNEFQKVEATAFASAKVGHRLRMNFASMKLGAQGHIVDGNWKVFADANTYEKLPTAWGDYYEYTITQSMLDSLQERGLVVSGVGYTLTSVELIDPMREYVVATTFDTNDIRAWEPIDGTPNLSVTFTNYETDSVHSSIQVSLLTDMFADYGLYAQSVELAAGETKTVAIEFPDLEPGFYRMSAKANGKAICTYYIGYDPTAIVSPDDSQSDFGTFWTTWLNRLAEIPIDATLTLLGGEESDTRNIYEVKYLSVPETVGGEPVYIYGYYAEPKAEGKYPCIIHFHGTDKSGNLTKPSATETGWCEFRFSARGQTLDKAKNGSEKYRTDPADESSVDFYAYRLGDNDEHYYRYVYLDTRRAVDFVRTQAKVDTHNIFAAGGSQGGCLTYVCAALSGEYIRAIAPSITGHADFVHTMEIVGWPTNVFNNWINAQVTAGTYATYEEGKAALLAHQSYFDTKNFAKWITCPVITNFSLQDQTDGPHLNISPYNLLTVTDKEYSINPFKGHATADDWSTTYMNFFKDRLYEEPETPTAVEDVSSETSGAAMVLKKLRDGQLFIVRNGTTYTVSGQIIQ